MNDSYPAKRKFNRIHGIRDKYEQEGSTKRARSENFRRRGEEKGNQPGGDRRRRSARKNEAPKFLGDKTAWVQIIYKWMFLHELTRGHEKPKRG